MAKQRACFHLYFRLTETDGSVIFLAYTLSVRCLAYPDSGDGN